MDPYAGNRERLIGDVSEIHSFYLPERFGWSEDFVSAINLDRTFPGLKATQVTILVDDILNDPDAVDVMSYTVWCPTGTVPDDISKRHPVDATIVAYEVLSIGYIWLVESLDHPSLE